MMRHVGHDITHMCVVHMFVSGCFAVPEGWLSLKGAELSCGLLNSAIHKQGFGYAKQPDVMSTACEPSITPVVRPAGWAARSDRAE
jgi:hypothetical protein